MAKPDQGFIELTYSKSRNDETPSDNPYGPVGVHRGLKPPTASLLRRPDATPQRKHGVDRAARPMWAALGLAPSLCMAGPQGMIT